MRDYGKVHTSCWTSTDGKEYRIPVTGNRLKFKYPAHAAIRAHVFKRDGFRCVKCGWVPKSVPENYDGRYTLAGDDVGGKRRELHIDHIHPISLGGSNHPNNFQTLCFGCNSSKGAKISHE